MNNATPIPWTIREILEATHGELQCGNISRRFGSVSIDSRRIAAPDLFIAIVGDVHDGHAFANDVVDQGIKGLIVNRANSKQLPWAAWKKRQVACIAVEDTTRALGALAAFNRRRTAVSVVAITGSNGKTTTRKLTAAVMARQFNTLATIGNLNNQIGMPLTLLRLEPEHEWAVLELGTNHPGEIATLAEICSPDIGVITNVGPAHLEGLGSLEGVMHAKGELLEKLKPNGMAVLNADDPMVFQLARNTDKAVTLFGTLPDAAIRARAIKETACGISFELVLPAGHEQIDLNTAGRFMVSNALAAAAVGHVIGLTPASIKAGMENFEPQSGRMNILDLGNGIHIMDDTYNANPASMQAAIQTLTRLRGRNRSVLVLGDMRELGQQAEALHKDLGAIAAASEVQRLYVSGEFAQACASGAVAEHMQSDAILIGSFAEIISDLEKWLQPGDWILVKGSRAMGMEKVVEELKAWSDKSGR